MDLLFAFVSFSDDLEDNEFEEEEEDTDCSEEELEDDDILESP